LIRTLAAEYAQYVKSKRDEHDKEVLTGILFYNEEIEEAIFTKKIITPTSLDNAIATMDPEEVEVWRKKFNSNGNNGPSVIGSSAESTQQEQQQKPVLGPSPLKFVDDMSQSAQAQESSYASRLVEGEKFKWDGKDRPLILGGSANATQQKQQRDPRSLEVVFEGSTNSRHPEQRDSGSLEVIDDEDMDDDAVENQVDDGQVIDDFGPISQPQEPSPHLRSTTGKRSRFGSISQIFSPTKRAKIVDLNVQVDKTPKSNRRFPWTKNGSSQISNSNFLSTVERSTRSAPKEPDMPRAKSSMSSYRTPSEPASAAKPKASTLSKAISKRIHRSIPTSTNVSTPGNCMCYIVE